MHDSAEAPRKPRADSERNRARLVEVAKLAFAETGAGVSLEQVAREAGVGIGTLYRHFPTRDALIEAVYRNENETLIAQAERLAAEHEPMASLREWLLLFVDYLAAKKGLAEALRSLIGGTDALYSDSSERITRAIGALVGRAVEAGQARPDIEPMDLLRAIAGVANMSPGKDWRPSAARMVDVLLAGLGPAR